MLARRSSTWTEQEGASLGWVGVVCLDMLHAVAAADACTVNSLVALGSARLPCRGCLGHGARSFRSDSFFGERRSLNKLCFAPLLPATHSILAAVWRQFADSGRQL